MIQKLALLGGKPLRTRPFNSWPIHNKSEERSLLRTLRSGNWGRLQGQEVANFEKRFAAAHGCEHGIAVVNGTVSLRIGLLAAGIQAEDEVIVPPYTFLSTASAVIESNAVPVFADIDLHTFNLDPKAVEAAITPRTKAIIPVHFAGQPADMDGIMAIGKKHNLLVIEDAAHAHGASYQDRPAGSIGHLGSFSFQSSKNMTAGEGGIITTNDETLAEACRSIQSCGRIPSGPWYEHHVISGNYRLGEFQGAILSCQLDRLEDQTKRRDRNGQYLAAKLSRFPGIFPQQRPSDCTRHSYHLMMLRVEAEHFGVSRDTLVEALCAERIPCSAGYAYSLPQQPIFENKAFGPYIPKATARLKFNKVRCPNSDLICKEQCVWLGQNIFLGQRKDMDDIADAFEKIYEQRQTLNAKFPSNP
ncbi:MAG: DegT/DnrJ/EryC1/StrS family aminotransferase [Verrucomicrobia bacterium]|nr:MAG: DegT/DnrJ/EryC1/StrS family aminotransferase [Verrucomicrobiota bacterium]